MRSKEHAHDYRYFPEPDLIPLRISEAWLTEIRSSMVELPSDRRDRFIRDLGVREYDAQVLTATRDLSDFFEQTARASGDPRSAANWVMGELMGALRAQDKEIAESPVSAANLGELIALIGKGEISGKLAKEIFPKMIATGQTAVAIIEREGLKQISDISALEKIVEQVIVANPKQVDQYRGGKTSVIAFFVGQVMKATRGQANPTSVNEILRAKLG
jgi:aspartyl-tRNA(Asn)/glutamyl-tRNA(Gln) amidotransferase subunit B